VSDFDKKFEVERFLLVRTAHWRISVRPVQVTLGSLIVSSNNKSAGLSSLSKSESGELGFVFALASKILDDAFSPYVINFLGLMLVDPRVHFHLIPRYEYPLAFGGQKWEDKSFPAMLTSLESERTSASDESLGEIFSVLNNHAKKSVAQSGLALQPR
jgi:diadenosine tetraphosphate (Ap4A) HIT family hydrolase